MAQKNRNSSSATKNSNASQAPLVITLEILVIIAATLVLLRFGWILIWMLIQFKSDIQTLRDVIFLLLEIIGMLLVFGLLYIFNDWLCGKNAGTIVLPFDNTVDEKQYFGKAIYDSLIAEINRIRYIHNCLLECEDKVR